MKMIQRFFWQNFSKLMVYMILPVVLVGVIFYGIVSTHLQQDVLQRMNYQIKQSEQITQLLFQTFDAVNVLVSSNTSIMRALRHLAFDKNSTYEDYKQLQNMRHSIVSVIASNKYVDSVYVYMLGAKKYYSSNEGFISIENSVDTAWINYVENNDELFYERMFTREVDTQLQNATEHSLLSICSKMFSGMSQQSGVVIVNIDIAKLRDYLKSFSYFDEQIVYLVDQEESVCLTENLPELSTELRNHLYAQEGMSRLIIDGVKYTISVVEMHRANRKFVSIIPTSAINGTYQALLNTWIFCIIGLLILASFLSVKEARNNRQNINAVLNAFEAAERGMDCKLIHKKKPEIYNYIIRSIIQHGILKKYMEVQISEKKYMQKVLEQSMLQYQMNPHFLTNTIKTIYWKVVEAEGFNSPTARMAENMLDFTGYILSPPSEMVTIREEVLHTQSYIDILQARHAGEFKVVWEIDDAALQALTCRVILQPLVENAYYHGIRKSAKEGVKNIWIKIHDTGDEILIRVIDNGSGMEQELVAKIQEQLADPNVLEKHIGIYNPHKRIRLHFGGQSGIYIHSHLGVGTCIIVRFPHVKQEEKEN